ncbi:hypothetical protein H4R33_003336 [Dimargaris cristalligena]|nr:hypothetical protein H4R33_003336 [Dimargaris cristalligena]
MATNPATTRHRKEDVLEFLESLDLTDVPDEVDPIEASATSPTEGDAGQPGRVSPGTKLVDPAAPPSSLAAGSPPALTPNPNPTPTPAVASSSFTKTTDHQDMLKFIDDLTESAQNSLNASPTPPTTSQIPPPTPARPAAATTTTTSNPSTSTTVTTQADPPAAAEPSWSWNGLWNSTSHIVKSQVNMASNNNYVQSTYSAAKGTLDTVRASEHHRHINHHIGALNLGERLGRIGTNLRSSVNSVIDTIAPPLEDNGVFNVAYAANLPGADSLSHLIYREFDAVVERFSPAEVLVKPSQSFAKAKELHAEAGHKFIVPKGIEAGFAKAQSILEEMITTDRSGLCRAAEKRKEEIERNPHHPLKSPHCAVLIVLQPCMAAPASSVSSIFICGLLFDPLRQIEARTISQSITLDTWVGSVKDADSLEYEIVQDVIGLTTKSLAHDFMIVYPKHHPTSPTTEHPASEEASAPA